MPTTDELRARFGFVDQLAAAAYQPLEPGAPARVDRLTVTLETAPAELMYRQADNVGMNDNSWIGSGEPPYLVARQAQYLAVVLTSDKVAVWTEFHYARDCFGVFAPQQVAYLGWMTVQSWYEQPNKTEQARGLTFGAYHSREVHIALYEPPAQGFDWLYRTATLADAYLNSRLVMRGYIAQDPEWVALSERLNGLAALFAASVYQAGLRTIIDASRRKGMSGQFGDLALRSYVALGRVMVTIDHPQTSVTFMGAEDGDQLGWHGMQGSFVQLEWLVGQMIQTWESLTEAERWSLYHDDDGVSPWPWV